MASPEMLSRFSSGELAEKVEYLRGLVTQHRRTAERSLFPKSSQRTADVWASELFDVEAEVERRKAL